MANVTKESVVSNGKTQTKTLEITWYDADILRINIVEGAEFDLSDSIDNLNILNIVTEGRKHLQLVDARTFWSSSKESREFCTSEEIRKNITGRAIIVDSLSGRLMAHFFIKVSHSHSNTKIFNSEAKAVSWLKNLK